MSTLRVDNLRARTGTALSITEGNSIIVGGGMSVTGNLDVTGTANINSTGVITATSFSGSGLALTGVGTDNLNTNNIKVSGISTFGGAITASGGVVGNVTGNCSGTSGSATGNAGGLTGNPSVSVTNLTVLGDQTVGGGLTVTGNMTVDGTQTIINTSTLDVADKTVGLGSTTAATNTTAAGAGIEIYASSATANNNKTILWQNTSNCFEFSESTKFKGISETSINNGATGVQTYINGTSLVLEFDLEAGSVFNYTSPSVALAAQAGGIGIVSFKNMPANAQNIRTVTLVHTQGKGTAGFGNTNAVQGIGVTCTVIPKSGGSAVAGISTRAFCGGGSGAASTVTCSPDYGSAGNVSGDIDVISFMIHYTGGTNTQLSSYKVFVTKNGGYTQGSVGV